MNNKGKFGQGEKCYVPFVDGNYYEAKILKTQQQSDGWFYLVHYMGWNKKWDEWVEEAGIIKQDAYAQIKQQQQQDQSQQYVSAHSMSSEGEGTATATGTTPAGSKRNGSGDSGKPASRNGDLSSKKQKIQRDSYDSSQQMIVLEIPLKLKKQLVDMYEQVKEHNMLISLPRTPNVNDILNDFLKEFHKPEDGLYASDVDREIINGTRLYFDQALPLVLLYNNEKHLHNQYCPQSLPSQVYGAEHLLRLFVKISDLLAGSSLSEDEFLVIQGRMQNLLVFMNTNYHRLFLPFDAYQSPATIQQSMQLEQVEQEQE